MATTHDTSTPSTWLGSGLGYNLGRYTFALVAQWIEHQLAELRVVGSSPIERAKFWNKG